MKKALILIAHHIIRYVHAVREWGAAAVAQSDRRVASALPGVEEFIALRRLTIGQRTVERTYSFPFTIAKQTHKQPLLFLAVVEYSLGVDLPDKVFENPIMLSISNCISDALTWPQVSSRQSQLGAVRLLIALGWQDLASFNVSFLF